MKIYIFAFCLTFFQTLPSWSQVEDVRVLIVSPEQVGILQTGGLADATRGLNEGLNAVGVKTDVLMPFYLDSDPIQVSDSGEKMRVELDWQNGHPHKAAQFSLLRSQDASQSTLFLRHDSSDENNYFNNRRQNKKEKFFYAPEARIGESFGAFAKAAADYILSKNYDVVILNDWTTGLVAVHLAESKARGLKVPKVAFAIHNIAYQGTFPKSLVDYLGLSQGHFTMDGYEYWGQVNFLKAGLQYSDMVYTVSPRYAQEISTPRFGAGLDGVIRQKLAQGKMTGILNGILNHEWDPTISQPGLEWTFDVHNLKGKALGKVALQKKLNLAQDGSTPMFVLTSRLAEQKGFEYLIEALKKGAQTLQAQWVVIGDGELGYAEKLAELQRKYPDNFRYLPFDRLLEKQLIRYGDFFVNAAWFEPSGLNQFFALKTGTIPVVSAVGGLLNSIKPGVNGLLFSIIPGADGANYDKAATAQSIYEACKQALNLYHNPKRMREMRVRGMSEDNSWLGRIKSDFRTLIQTLIQRDILKQPNTIMSCSKLFAL